MNGGYKNCPMCKKDFLIKKKSQLDRRTYCSYRCLYESKKRGSYKKCLTCGKEYYSKDCLLNIRKFCSLKCRNINDKGKPTFNKGFTPRLIEYNIPRCKLKGKSTISESHYNWCSQSYNLSYVPKGFIIHHIDGNSLNNDPNNLFLMTNSDHVKLHQVICKKLWRIKNGK